MKITCFMWRVLIRILFMIVGTAISITLLLNGYYYNGLLFGTITIVILLNLYQVLSTYFNGLQKVLTAIIYDDFSNEFPLPRHESVYQKAIVVYEKYRVQLLNYESQNIVYNQLLETVFTSILILRKEHEEWRILLMNQHFRTYFKVPDVRSWKYLHSFIPDFCELIENKQFKEYKTTVDIQIEKEERQTFVLQTSNQIISGKEYYIIMLDSVQRVIDATEKEAWISVMKVISHELMNSLTPIHSLAQNVDEMVQEENLTDSDKEDIRVAIKTIVNRSNHLQQFVERYRKLTMLPTPDKKAVDLHDIIEQSLQNMKSLFKEAAIEIHWVPVKNYEVKVDVVQFEQVLINLLTNAYHALKHVEKREVEIRITKEAQRIYIDLFDSGALIDPEIITKIFLPFYTTRRDGAGIGLTLSKTIVEAHGGYLIYQQLEEKNCFRIIL